MPIALQTTTRKTLATRLRRAGLFLAITLSIAGAFQLIEHIVLFSSLREAVVDWVESASRKEPRAVAPSTAAVRPANIPEELWQASPRLVWALGLRHGMAAAVTPAAVGKETPASSRAFELLQDEVHKISTALDVPPPALPVIRQRAYVMSEFAESLEEQPTAKALAQRYSSRHAALFRLGALSGYRYVNVRIGGSPLSVFKSEMRRHGKAAGLAEDIWQPLASRLSTSGKEAAAEFDQRLQSVYESLAPAGAGSP